MTEWTGVRDKRVLITGATRGHRAGCCSGTGAPRSATGHRCARRCSRSGGRQEHRRGGGIEGRPAPRRPHLAGLGPRSGQRGRSSGTRVSTCWSTTPGAAFSTRQLTEDGIERTWALNHLAPFLLTTLLLDRLKASAPARIITTSSDAHKGKLIPFDDLNAERSWKGRGFTRYGETKLANIMFTRELARRLDGTGVTAYSFHPGLVATGFNRNNGALMSTAMTLIAPFSRSPRKAAQTLVWLADSPDVSKQSGGYYEDRALAVSSRQAQDPALARQLWEVSEEQVRPRTVAGVERRLISAVRCAGTRACGARPAPRTASRCGSTRCAAP